MISRIASLSLLLLATACASITQGTTQSVGISTDPPGATCTISRGGQQLASVARTPGTVTVSKSSRALDVRCTRADHNPALISVPSSTAAMTAGNLLVGGVVGLAVDAGTGAMNYYPANVAVTLTPVAPPPAAMPEPAPPRPRR